MNSDDGFIPGAILGMITCAIIAFSIWQHNDNSWKTEAKNHGCAEFYIDSNNTLQWRWK